MSIFTGILFIICSLFALYKIVINFIQNRKNSKKNNNIINAENFVDLRVHSLLSFDFPNVQSEADMKIVNSGPDLCKVQDEIQVKQYCKY